MLKHYIVLEALLLNQLSIELLDRTNLKIYPKNTKTGALTIPTKVFGFSS